MTFYRGCEENLSIERPADDPRKCFDRNDVKINLEKTRTVHWVKYCDCTADYCNTHYYSELAPIYHKPGMYKECLNILYLDLTHSHIIIFKLTEQIRFKLVSIRLNVIIEVGVEMR